MIINMLVLMSKVSKTIQTSIVFFYTNLLIFDIMIIIERRKKMNIELYNEKDLITMKLLYIL